MRIDVVVVVCRAASTAEGGDALAKMNAFFSKLKEKMPDEMDAPISVRDGGSSHHIGHYLPKQAMDRFYAKASGGKVLLKDDKHRIKEDNKGHQMLMKMGWSEGACCARCDSELDFWLVT